MKLLPRRLRPGDNIGIISPSSPPDPEKLQQGINYLNEQGYGTVIGRHVLDRRTYLAGQDADRAADLNEMFIRKDIQAVFCAQGGYGAVRTLRHLDWAGIRANPKIFLGYSDITAFHVAFQKEVGLVTFHGPLLAHEVGATLTAYTEERLWQAVSSTEPLGVITNPPDGPSVQIVRGGSATGELVGGNLSLIASLAGTPYELDTRGKILVLEDVDEAPYRVDRMLMTLLWSGALQGAAGIVFGESINCQPSDPNSPSLNLAEVLDDLIRPLGLPAIYGLCCGHGRHKATLPLGVSATLEADRGRLIIDEAGVRN
jgi:muramoyltetrapeptide carboxypeptidase